MAAIHSVNPNADLISAHHALQINSSAAKGLMDVLKTNLGPDGTLKMLVSGAGDVKLTKDGCVLLHQMQIQHPTASLIARNATAQDDTTGDGTTSSVLFTGELVRQAERWVVDGLHPRTIVDGIEMAREETLKFIKGFATEKKFDGDDIDREFLANIARTSLRTKLHQSLADHLTEIIVDAVLAIRKPGESIDLFMIEIQHMVHMSDLDTKLVKGLVLDHGARHPDMKKRSEDCFILTCNVSLEYEKTEVNSSFFYKSAEEREALVKSERDFTNQKVMKIVELKERVCKDSDKGFVVINQKGIDPISLDILQRNGIVGIRRAKRRNMERLSLSCGGYAVNSVEDLNDECLGHADEVYEHTLGEDKYTFVEGVKNPRSVTILIRGPNKHSIAQIKEAIRDGTRAVKNAIEEQLVVAGAGAIEAALHLHLMEFAKTVKGRPKRGVEAFAAAALIIPKTLARNSGLDPENAIISLLENAQDGTKVGLDISDGSVILPEEEGIWDSYRAKRSIFHLGATIARNLLLVDEVMRAGKRQGGGP